MYIIHILRGLLICLEKKDVFNLEIFNEIKERLSIFNNLYDNLRIIDPINKKVILLQNDGIESSDEVCYGFWNRNEFCDNCVSIRAYIHNDTFVKLEYASDKIHLIIATPVNYKGSNFILELIKEISEESSIKSGVNSNNTSIKSLIEKMNNKKAKDDLTKLYNSKYISERLPVDIEKCLFEGCSLSIILADIDGFTIVNELYGEETGDKVLKDFAQLLLNAAGEDSCWIARYGGDGFLIVMKDNNNPYAIAENLRRLIENASFVYEDIIIKVTSSFGVYTTDYSDTKAELVLNKVESNLHIAKMTGRNVIIK